MKNLRYEHLMHSVYRPNTDLKIQRTLTSRSQASTQTDRERRHRWDMRDRNTAFISHISKISTWPLTQTDRSWHQWCVINTQSHSWTVCVMDWIVNVHLLYSVCIAVPVWMMHQWMWFALSFTVRGGSLLYEAEIHLQTAITTFRWEQDRVTLLPIMVHHTFLTAY